MTGRRVPSEPAAATISGEGVSPAASAAASGSPPGNEAAPTFANTVEALERSGSVLTRVSNVFFAVEGAHSNDALREVARTVAPELAAHRDNIRLNRALYDRVRAVYDRREMLELTPEQNRLLEEIHKRFVRSGVALGDAEQARPPRARGARGVSAAGER